MLAALRQWKYRIVIPNAITCFGLSLGIVSVFLSVNGKYDQAAWLVMWCVILDKLDGTAARGLNAGSEFGMQLDSLSDLVTFTVAPAVLYVAALAPPEGRAVEPGWLAFLPYFAGVGYVTCGAIRLARFNCAAATGAGLKKFFIGVPTTMVGGVAVSLYLSLQSRVDHLVLLLLASGVMAILALLMVSPWYLPKLNMDRKYKIIKYLQVLVLLVAPFLVVFQVLPEYFLAVGVLYVTGGLLWSNRRSVRVE